MIDCGFQHYLLEKADLVRAQPGLLTALLEYLTVLLEYLAQTARIWEGLGPVRPALGYAIVQR